MRLPNNLISKVLDHLEPEELIQLHRANKEFRKRVARRGLLPGRVRMFRIYGQILAEEHEGVLLKRFEFGVESQGGTLIIASNLSNRIFHVLDRDIPLDAREAGDPNHLRCLRIPDDGYRLPLKTFRTRWRRFFKPLLQMLRRIQAVEELEMRLDGTYQQSIYGMPFEVMNRYRSLGSSRERALPGSKLKKNSPIQIASLLQALRHIDHCYFQGGSNEHFTKTRRFFGGVPASLRIQQAWLPWEFGFVPRDADDSFAKTFDAFLVECVSWPKTAFLWQECLASTLNLISRWSEWPENARPRPGLLCTLAGYGVNQMSVADFEAVKDYLESVAPTLIALEDSCPKALALRAAFAREYFARPTPPAVTDLGAIAASWCYREDETSGGMTIMVSVHLMEDRTLGRVAFTMMMDV